MRTTHVMRFLSLDEGIANGLLERSEIRVNLFTIYQSSKGKYILTIALNHPLEPLEFNGLNFTFCGRELTVLGNL